MANDETEIQLPANADHVQVLYPSKYLRKEDLHMKDVTLTIERVALRDVRMTNNSIARKVVIHFGEMANRPADERKVWICPKTAALEIAALHGPDPRQWAGKKITIYHEEGIYFGSKKVGGIRVRDRVVERGKKADEPATA